MRQKNYICSVDYILKTRQIGPVGNRSSTLTIPLANSTCKHGLKPSARIYLSVKKENNRVYTKEFTALFLQSNSSCNLQLNS